MGQTEKLELVYKYETINKHLFENLQKNQLYFENPWNYNDPFDSKINGCLKYTEKELIKEILEQNPYANQVDVRHHISLMINNGELTKDVKTGLLEQDIQSRPSPFACCFSEKRNNILMWSHYANKHKGVCLSYKTIQTQTTQTFSHTTPLRLTIDLTHIPLWKVKYCNKKPDYKNYAVIEPQEHLEPFFDNLLTKSKCWKYEYERRLISLDKKNIHKFKKEELEGIIFGLKVKHYDAYKVYKIVEKYYINEGIPINIYKAIENKNYYRLDITKIKEAKIDDYIESLP